MDRKFLQDSIKLLTRNAIDFGTDIIDGKTIIYIYLDPGIELSKLIEIWGLLDSLDFEIWKGWDTKIEIYSVVSQGVIKFQVLGKKTYATPSYNPGNTYNSYKLPTMTNSSKRWSVPKEWSTNHRTEITIYGKNSFELKSIREDFENLQIDAIDKTLKEVFFDYLEGPKNYDQKDYYYWSVKEFGSKMADIEIEKFKGPVYIITITTYLKYSKSVKYYKCQSLSEIDAMIKYVFNWIPF